MNKEPCKTLDKSKAHKAYDDAFYEQLDYIMQQFREGNIKSVPEVMHFIEMIYGDYIEFHPGELPEPRCFCETE